MTSADQALHTAAALGPYFTWERWSAGAGWRPLTELTDGDVVAERVDAARSALMTMFALDEDAVPARVIASVTFLGVASRLLSPPLGAAVLAGALPIVNPHQLWWRPVPGGPWPIAYSHAVVLPVAVLPVAVLPVADPPGADSPVVDPPGAGPDGSTEVPPVGDSAVRAYAGSVVDGLVAPILRAVQDRFALSGQVLWGNVASALAGAAGMLADAHPERAEATGRLVQRALARPPLAGTGTLVRPDPARARRFLVRNNCCLYYRIPGGGTCGDCVLTAEADRLAAWRSVLDRSVR